MKSVLAHAVLAIGGLALAYMVWTEEEGPAQSEDLVTVWECDASQVKHVHLSAKNRHVDFAVQGRGDDRSYWITTRREPEEGEGREEAFVGGEAAGEYLEQIAPLKALRSLGTPTDAQLEELELDDPEAQISIECGSKTREFAIGGSAYGSGDRYLRDPEGGQVFLVPAAVVRDLESAEFRLMQRDLHNFEMTEVEHLVVKGYDHQRRLLQRNRRETDRAEWVDAEQPDRRNELYGNWMTRLARLRVTSYLSPDAAPGSDLEGEAAAAASEQTMELVYLDADGDPLGHLQMVRVDAAMPEYYVKTDATRHWVKVPRSAAIQVEDDARELLGLEPLVRPEPAAEPEATGPGSPGSAPDGSAADGSAPEGGAADGTAAAGAAPEHAGPEGGAADVRHAAPGAAAVPASPAPAAGGTPRTTPRLTPRPVPAPAVPAQPPANP